MFHSNEKMLLVWSSCPLLDKSIQSLCTMYRLQLIRKTPYTATCDEKMGHLPRTWWIYHFDIHYYNAKSPLGLCFSKKKHSADKKWLIYLQKHPASAFDKQHLNASKSMELILLWIYYSSKIKIAKMNTTTGQLKDILLIKTK